MIYSWGGKASTSLLIASLEKGRMNTENDAVWEAWFSRVSSHLDLYRLAKDDPQGVSMLAPSSIIAMAALIEQDSLVAEAASYHLDGPAAAAAGRVRDKLDHLAGIACKAYLDSTTNRNSAPVIDLRADH
jgi:hypothetical protein